MQHGKDGKKSEDFFKNNTFKSAIKYTLFFYACVSFIFGEGNGNPLQYSCLENSIERGAWWAAVCEVAQSRTRLKRLSSSSSSRASNRDVGFQKPGSDSGYPVAQMVKNLPAMQESLIPGLGRSSGGGNGNPLQYSCLENSIDREALWATVHGVTKSWTQLSY